MEAPGISFPVRGGGVPARRAARGVALTWAVALLLGLAAPALAEVSQDDIGAADQGVAEARARLAEAEGRLAEEQRSLDRFEESLDRVTLRIASQDVAVEGGRAEARDRVVLMYMAAGAGPEAGLLGGSEDGFGAQVAYLGALAEQDREFVQRLAASRTDLSRLAESVRRSLADQRGIVDEAADQVAARRRELSAAEGVAAEVRAQWEREEAERRRIAEEERLRLEEEERLRLEEEEQQRQEAQAAIEEAAAAASAAGWTPGSGVEPWRLLVARYFPDRLVEEALSVMRCESLGNPLAVNVFSGAAGLFQQMPYYWPSRAANAGWAGASIFDPEANIAVSAWLVLRSEEGGSDPWSHWSCKP